MKRALSVTAALGFVAFFVIIIQIANRGEGGRWWAFIDHIPYGDKVGHLGLVGTLSFLCNLAIPAWKFSRLPRFVTPTTLVLLVLLTAEEFSQAFQPFRTCDFYDWLADLAGLALGQIAAHLLRERFFQATP